MQTTEKIRTRSAHKTHLATKVTDSGAAVGVMHGTQRRCNGAEHRSNAVHNLGRKLYVAARAAAAAEEAARGPRNRKLKG